tara:strand:- start:576 stop:872 length:297 start_codon:yes stop_codon:yes gene_type:complete
VVVFFFREVTGTLTFTEMTANTTASMDELLKQYENIASTADIVKDKCLRLIQIILDKKDTNMDDYGEACEVAGYVNQACKARMDKDGDEDEEEGEEYE